jgi:hypothetical protein
LARRRREAVRQLCFSVDVQLKLRGAKISPSKQQSNEKRRTADGLHDSRPYLYPIVCFEQQQILLQRQTRFV